MSRSHIGKALLIMAVVFAGGSELLAQHAGHGGQAGNPGGQISQPAEPSRIDRTGRIVGRLVSESEDSITIETNQGGEPVRSVYALDQRTEFRGAVRVGSQVSVTYIEQGGTRAATRVEGQRKRRGC